MRKTPPTKEAVARGRPPLPAPPPPGELPDENSRLWAYPPSAIRLGEAHIKPDTRAWFEEKGGVVQICRAYPDHPRWLFGSDRKSNLINDQICGEVHMLARITAGLPELPKIALRQMEVKMVQADAAYRLISAVRKVSTPQRLEETLTLLADRQPGQFLKLVRDISKATYVPAGAEQGPSVPDAKQLDAIIAALGDELKRRQSEAKTITLNPQDVEFSEPENAYVARGMVLHEAAAVRDGSTGVPIGGHEMVQRIKQVVDVNAEDYDDGWD